MKNQDKFTLWGVQSQDGVLLHSYNTREDARMWCGSLQQVVKLECRVVEQRPKKPKKPEPFTAHGLEWIPHTPGDPMPCDGEKRVRALLRNGSYGQVKATEWHWGKLNRKKAELIGWNYAP